VKYKDPEAFRTALEARLRQPSDVVGDLSRRRRTVAFDRLLERLAVAGHDAWLGPRAPAQLVAGGPQGGVQVGFLDGHRAGGQSVRCRGRYTLSIGAGAANRATGGFVSWVPVSAIPISG